MAGDQNASVERASGASIALTLMIVFVGGLVGFIAISMYLPIFSLYEKIR